MSDRMRYRSGPMHLQKVRVDNETVISAGDLVFLDTDDAKPASAFTWTTNLATTQAAFAEKFLGVAVQPSAAGETDPISVDVSPLSVYEFDVAAGAYEIGDELGPDELSAHLMSQQLEAVATGTRAIARAHEYRPSGSTTLRVTFASAFFTGSGNVHAVLG